MEQMRGTMQHLDIDDGLGEPETAVSLDAASESEEDTSDVVKIRDAMTDKTIVSVTEAAKVRAAANALDAEPDPEEIVKIRDAMTDKTIVSVTEAAKVREAANALDAQPDLEDIVKIRDAMTDKTIVSVTEAAKVRAAANMQETEPDLEDIVKIRDAMTDKTIVSVTQASRVREAAGGQEFYDDLSLEDLAELDLMDSLDSSFVDDSAYEETEPEETQVFRRQEEYQKREPKSSSRHSYQEKYRQYDDREDYGRKYDSRNDRHDNSYDYDRSYDGRRDRYNTGYSGYDRRYDGRGYDDYDDFDRKEQQTSYVRSKSPLRFIPLVLVIALCVLAFITLRTICNDVPMNASDYSKIPYTVTAETTDETLARDLLELGLIDNSLVFRLRCLFYSAKYVPGTYELSPCYSTEKMINILSGYVYGEE